MNLALLFLSSNTLVHLSAVDLVIIVFYFALVLGIGFYLKGQANTGEDFFMAGREMTAWVAGLAFLSANLGSLELMGWAGNSYKYGILAAHWYWIGAIPSMLFLALVMMPFYYVCKTHSVPGLSEAALRSRCTDALLDLVRLHDGADERHQHVCHGRSYESRAGMEHGFQHLGFVASPLPLYVALGGLRSAIFNEVLQFFLIWAGRC